MHTRTNREATGIASGGHRDVRGVGHGRSPPPPPEGGDGAVEVADYEIRLGADATDRYGAFKTGAHDGLVTALGLAAIGEPARSGSRSH